MKSESPRTDAAEFTVSYHDARHGRKVVSADFARQLERELTETKLLLAYKNDTANTFMAQIKKLQSERAAAMPNEKS